MATKHAAPRPRAAQLNIRSDYVRERATTIARETGMTATQVVEDAMRRYVSERGSVPDGMERVGHVLVFKPFGLNITAEEAQRSLDESRERDIWGADDDGAA